MTERKVLVTTIYGSLTPTWHEWEGDDPAVAAAEMAKRQGEGKTRPVEVIVVEVVRRISITTRVDVIDDSAAEAS